MHEWSLHVRYSWRAWLGGHGFPPANIKIKKNTQLLLLLVYCCCYSCHFCCFSCFNVLERWPFDTIFLRPEPLYNISDSMVMVLLSWVTTWGQYTAPFSPPQQATVCKLHVKKKSIHLDIPLLQQQNAKKLYGTKDNAVHSHLGQIRNTRYKEIKKSNCHFWRAWSKSRLLYMPPAHNINGKAKQINYPSSHDPWTHPYPHPHICEQVREPVCSHYPPGAAEAVKKPHLKKINWFYCSPLCHVSLR